jgi:hypothetical protein
MSAAARLRMLLSCLLAAGALAACGGADETASTAASSPSASSTANAAGTANAASAGKAAKTAKSAPARPEDSLPKARCPSKASGKLSGPDIVGLKLGMSFDEALNHARCAVPTA